MRGREKDLSLSFFSSLTARGALVSCDPLPQSAQIAPYPPARGAIAISRPPLQPRPARRVSPQYPGPAARNVSRTGSGQARDRRRTGGAAFRLTPRAPDRSRRAPDRSPQAPSPAQRGGILILFLFWLWFLSVTDQPQACWESEAIGRGQK